ncbi:hypothetical protein D9X30_1308 [Cupriavidus sp. U2]|nr:hypothetical protein D9X30_1308 [Cupriavidus sp. U2]
MTPVERSILVQASPDRVWLLGGDYCAIARWDAALRRCDVVLGNGAPGTVRRMVYRAGGLPAVDVLTDRGPWSYSYRKLSGHTRGRWQVAAGPDAGTTVVTWQVWLDPFALPNGAGSEYPLALGDEMLGAMERLRQRAEADEREAAAEAREAALRTTPAFSMEGS